MSRVLTLGAGAAKSSPVGTPINVLKLELGEGIGDRFFSDRDLGTGNGLSALNAQGRVSDWGRVSLALAERAISTINDGCVELLDADGALRALFRQVEFQRKRATLYQYFEGLGESDLAPVLVGVIDSPVRWDESRAALRFDITDISTMHRATVGTPASRGTFPLVAERDEDRTLPLVYGRVPRAEAVHAVSGATAVLVRACRNDDVRLFMDDASGFPQNTTLRIRIELELLEGHFEGNTFHVSARGLGLLTGRHTSRVADMFHVEDSSLPGGDNAYAGHFIRMTDPGDNEHHRPIIYYSADLHRLRYMPPIIYDNAYWTAPAGTAYDITTWARPHPAGTGVYLAQESFVYILNDAPSKKVKQLYGYGRVLGESIFEDGQKEALDIEGWAPMDPNHYTVNLNDTTTFPGLGHAVTTATFRHNPKELYPRLKDDRLWADVEGIDGAGDGTGALVENPAEVIRNVLTRRMGLTAAELDEASFTQAAQELGGFRMGFALDRAWDGLHLCADLAFQGRCALLWEDGKARLRVIKNRLGSAAATLDANGVEEGSVRIGRTALKELASEVEARFGQGKDRKAVVLRDAGVESAYGRRVRSIDLWAYNDRRTAVSAARFWLDRWKRLYEEVRLTAFLNALELQRSDTVTLDLPALFATGAKGEVREIDHEPGDGERRRMDRLTLSLRLPVVAGCASTCETECESGGESGCLTACEATAESGCWQCETQCETLCELACTTEAELNCIVNDTGGGSWHGCGGCETSCEMTCETGCESGCETGCQSQCEGTCESGCEGGCESGCETSCEEGCQTVCETGNESGCQTGCETSCEIACESAGCQTNCEAGCETGCESSCEAGCEGCETECQTGCEVNCELGCEAASCETGCELSCQTGCQVNCELSCEATACETGCEITCEVGCEVSCELSCEATACETGCETSCEVGCETQCELACEATSCEMGCETNCEVGCETVCESTCETNCELSCQTGCESGCETDCETGCETGCQTGCEVECETGCESSCETGCELNCELVCETGTEGYQDDMFYCMNETIHLASDCSDLPILVVVECWLGQDMPPAEGFGCRNDIELYRQYHLKYGPEETCPRTFEPTDACSDY